MPLSLPKLFVVVALVSLGGSVAEEVKLLAAPPRFVAQFANGEIVEHDDLREWHQVEAQPRLGGKPLLAAENPVRWLRDRRLRPGASPHAFLEMTTGDRLPGEVENFVAASPRSFEPLPAYFFVRPAGTVSPPAGEPHLGLRVLEKFVRRIVWRRLAAADVYRPGTLFYRDGRSISFRAARFEAKGVRLLQEAGTLRVSFADIAELHLPTDDGWNAYYDELATISPGGGRLIQLDTVDGLVATGSFERLQIQTHGDHNNPENWWHAVQPAWCLDTIWINVARIWMRRVWLPEEVPLSRFLPVASVSRSAIAGGRWKWQRDLNVRGGPIEAGGVSGGSGFGVHAYCELSFELPELATAFRTKLGLDQIARRGGSVQARVFAGSDKAKKLYESPVIVGSAKIEDTGALNLADLSAKDRVLVLEVDPLVSNRPEGADPGDIRDDLDWIDPTVSLNGAKLKEEVARRITAQVAALKDWQVIVDPAGTYGWSSDYEQFAHPRPGRFVSVVKVTGAPLTLRRTLRVGPHDHWLLISPYRRGGERGEKEIEVRINDLSVTEYRIPQRHGATPPAPLAISLEPFQGQEIKVDLIQRVPPSPDLPGVYWQAAAITDQLPQLYRGLEEELKLEDIDAKSGARFTSDDKYTGRQALEVLPDGRYRIAFAQPVSLRSTRNWGEYRMLRMCLRKFGKGTIEVELDHDQSHVKPAIYVAGGQVEAPPKEAKVRPPVNVWTLDLPEEWIVITRDAYGDFGDIDVTGLIFRVPTGGKCLFDHLYFAGEPNDFNVLTNTPSPELINENARRELARHVLDRGQPATTPLLIDGTLATGALIGGEGYVLTAGHLLAASPKEVQVQLPTGQKLPAQVLGIDRGLDVGLLKITDAMGLPLSGLELRDGPDVPSGVLYVGFSYAPFETDPPGAVAHIAGIKRDYREVIWTDFQPPKGTMGGALLDRDGRIVGVGIKSSPFGGLLFVKSHFVRQSWDRLKNSERWGEWFPGTGPMLGVVLTTAAEGAKITEVISGTPAAAAGLRVGDFVEKINDAPVASLEDVYRTLATKDPGDEVQVAYRRGKDSRLSTIKLTPRVP